MSSFNLKPKDEETIIYWYICLNILRPIAPYLIPINQFIKPDRFTILQWVQMKEEQRRRTNWPQRSKLQESDLLNIEIWSSSVFFFQCSMISLYVWNISFISNIDLFKISKRESWAEVKVFRQVGNVFSRV